MSALAFMPKKGAGIIRKVLESASPMPSTTTAPTSTR